MKKTMLLSLIFLFIASFAFAQKPLGDVVYLKNGSVIKGTIIEQVPNQSIKIKTADGSEFLYKTDEIEKITKEEVQEPHNNTRSGIYLGVGIDPGASFYYNNQLKGARVDGVGISAQSPIATIGIGPSLGIYPTNNFGIITGFTIIRYGTVYTTTAYTSDQFRFAAHLTYFEVPILVTYVAPAAKNKAAFFYTGGPNIGFLMKGTSVISGTLDNETDDISPYYSSVQLFTTMTGGARIPFNSIHCFLDVGLYLKGGVLNAFNAANATTVNSTTTRFADTFAAGIAIRFNWHATAFK